MTFSRAEDEGGTERRLLQVAEEPRPATAPSATSPAPEAGQALETARARDRLDWEHRCETAQRRINGAYALELNGKSVRQFSWLVMRWCLVVLLGSCFIAWTGWVAMLVCYLALAVLLLCLIGVGVGGGIELAAQLLQWSLLSRGEKDHLEVYDPSLRPVR